MLKASSTAIRARAAKRCVGNAMVLIGNRRAIWCAVLAGSVWACADPAVVERARADAAAQRADASEFVMREIALVDAALWLAQDRSRDPFADHRPDAVACGIAGFYAERGALEIDTAQCNYLAIEQPAMHSVRAGDEIAFELLHYDLTAPTPAAAHVALTLDGGVAWQTEIAIPAPANAITVSASATRAISAGAPIGFHLHNHGQNTWLLRALRVRSLQAE